MFRRTLIVVVLLCATSALLFARPRVTVVLRNGERVTGDLVYHHDNNMGLLVGGREQSWPQIEVAVIEFVSGQPSQQELANLPTARDELSRNAIVLRDGRVVPGKLYDISEDGNTVIINVTRTTRDSHGAGEIARLYLSPLDALNLYRRAQPNEPARPGQPNEPARPGQPNEPGGRAQPREPGRRPPVDEPPRRPRPGFEERPFATIQVEGRRPWTDTRIEVSRGERLSFEATGEVQWGRGRDQVAGPDGASIEGRSRRNYPVPDMGVGGLIARVGGSRPFPIGSNTGPIAMPADGVLYLGINDEDHGDNSGGFQVRVRRR